jgi:hypothetical protein
MNFYFSDVKNEETTQSYDEMSYPETTMSPFSEATTTSDDVLQPISTINKLPSFCTPKTKHQNDSLLRAPRIRKRSTERLNLDFELNDEPISTLDMAFSTMRTTEDRMEDIDQMENYDMFSLIAPPTQTQMDDLLGENPMMFREDLEFGEADGTDQDDNCVFCGRVRDSLYECNLCGKKICEECMNDGVYSYVTDSCRKCLD